MGSKSSKRKRDKPPKLTNKQYSYFEKKTNLRRDEIANIFKKFLTLNAQLQLDEESFVELYTSLRPEPPEKLEKISFEVFRCFDIDRNGYVSFEEFLLAFAATSQGDMKEKLDFAFDLYDIDNDGFIDPEEMEHVLGAMITLAGNKAGSIDVSSLTKKLINDLDKNNDGKVSKDEFKQGLLQNVAFRTMISPF